MLLRQKMSLAENVPYYIFIKIYFFAEMTQQRNNVFIAAQLDYELLSNLL